MSRSVEARCNVEIEQTPESFHAYSAPEGIEIAPGDVVVIHDPPTSVAYNEKLDRQCRMTVRRAGPFRRSWTRATGVFALTSLYEVGFEAEDAS